jgi:hypothetical protein
MLQWQIREQEKDDENSSNLNRSSHLDIICFDELRLILTGHSRYKEHATAALE